MEHTGITRIEWLFFKIAIQNNPASVNILNEEAIPAGYKTQVISWRIDKTAIKNTIKGGKSILGASLVNGTRLTIK